METWDEYKEYVKSSNSKTKKDIEEIETLASIVGAIVSQRKELGISQRELAAKCGIPQSTGARIETYRTSPNLDTLLCLLDQLGLSLVVCKK